MHTGSLSKQSRLQFSIICLGGQTREELASVKLVVAKIIVVVTAEVVDFIIVDTLLNVKDLLVLVDNCGMSVEFMVVLINDIELLVDVDADIPVGVVSIALVGASVEFAMASGDAVLPV